MPAGSTGRYQLVPAGYRLAMLLQATFGAFCIGCAQHVNGVYYSYDCTVVMLLVALVQVPCCSGGALPHATACAFGNSVL